MRPLFSLLILLISCFFSALVAIKHGAIDISASAVWQTLFAYDANAFEQKIVMELRIPRVILAFVAGNAKKY